MTNFGCKAKVGAGLLVGLACIMFNQSAWAHMSVSCNPSHNKIKLEWGFPCADQPENGKREAGTDGNQQNPPADVCLGPGFESQQNPAVFDNNVIYDGCCTGGEASYGLFVHGCAHAGGDGTASLASQASADEPYASVGQSIDSASPNPMRLHVERVATPGPAPDLVSVTLLGGGLQTRAGNGHASVALKLIVYPDAAAADADSSVLSGAGSNFFGLATLIGESGSLVAEQGFSSSDFLVQNDGTGTFTAIPVSVLTKTALVPDASTAVVTLVGDPKASPAGTTGVSGPEVASGLWLGPATPNPAPRGTHIRFAIPAAGHVRLTIYDQQGRRVRALANATFSGGEHEVVWDGQDAAGRRVSTALYFYRLSVDGKTLTGKVFMIH